MPNVQQLRDKECYDFLLQSPPLPKTSRRLYVPQPVAQATWQQIIRTCVLQRRKPHDHLKKRDDHVIISERKFILLPLFDASHYRIIILWEETRRSKFLNHCINGFTSGTNVPCRQPNKNAHTLQSSNIHNLFHAAMYTMITEVLWLPVHTHTLFVRYLILVYCSSSWIQITDHSVFMHHRGEARGVW